MAETNPYSRNTAARQRQLQEDAYRASRRQQPPAAKPAAKKDSRGPIQKVMDALNGKR